MRLAEKRSNQEGCRRRNGRTAPKKLERKSMKRAVEAPAKASPGSAGFGDVAVAGACVESGKTTKFTEMISQINR